MRNRDRAPPGSEYSVLVLATGSAERRDAGRGNYGERRESPGRGALERRARAGGAADEPGVTVTRGAWDRETRND